MVCRFGRGRCENDAVEGGVWCEEHQRYFEKLRAEIDAETGRSRPGRSRKRPKQCKFLDCTLKARPGGLYCKDHEAVVNP